MPNVGDTVPLSVQLFDSDTTKFARATVRDDSGTPVSGSPFSLGHVGNGRYESSSLLFPSGTNYVNATYEIFDDAGFTIFSELHASAIDTFSLTVPTTEIIECLDQLKLLIQGIAQVGDILMNVFDGDDIIIMKVDDNDIKINVFDDDDQKAMVVDDTDTNLNVSDSNDLNSTVRC